MLERGSEVIVLVQAAPLLNSDHQQAALRPRPLLESTPSTGRPFLHDLQRTPDAPA